MPYSSDPVTDRLFRHMAWANAQLFATLQHLPDATLQYAEPGNSWTVAMTLHHLVEAAAFYAQRLDDQPAPQVAPTPPRSTSDLPALAHACAVADARIRVAAATPHGVVVRSGDTTLTRARATVLAQAIHHATEHRAQIAGALVAHGSSAINLDDWDVWAYGDAEGLGA